MSTRPASKAAGVRGPPGPGGAGPSCWPRPARSPPASEVDPSDRRRVIIHPLPERLAAIAPHTTRPATHEVSHAVVIALELGGAVAILAAFTLGQLRLLDQHSLLYLLLNLVGSAVLAVIAFVDERWGFLLLEGVWAIVSAVSLAGVLRRGQEDGAHG